MIVMVTALLRVVVHSAAESDRVRFRPLLLQGRRKRESFWDACLACTGQNDAGQPQGTREPKAIGPQQIKKWGAKVAPATATAQHRLVASL